MTPGRVCGGGQFLSGNGQSAAAGPGDDRRNALK
jgi:hypothetical protein